MGELLLKVRNLKMHFQADSKGFRRKNNVVKAVDGVDLDLKEGEVLGLVGESGCGKSTLGRAIMKLYDPTDGIIEFLGENIGKMSAKDLKSRRKNFQMIFQDPFSSLNPRMTVEEILTEPFLIHDICSKDIAKEKIKELLIDVGLPIESVKKYPHEFSGGQRQRIGIARALALKPKLIVADEAVSALDVSIQSQVLNLLKKLRKKYSLSYIFISHDLAVVKHLCDRVAVMYLGKIVENAPTDQLYSEPKHPYTAALLASIPKTKVSGIAEKRKKRHVITGDVPSPLSPPSGCAFHPRCEKSMKDCDKIMPVAIDINGHSTACHLIK